MFNFLKKWIHQKEAKRHLVNESPQEAFYKALMEWPPDFEKAKRLLEEGVDINYIDERRKTMLSYVLNCYLVDLPFTPENDGRYLPQIVVFFLKNGYDIHSDNGIRGAIAAYALGDSSFDKYALEAAKILAREGINLNCPLDGDPLGCSAIDQLEIDIEHYCDGIGYEYDQEKVDFLFKLVDYYKEYERELDYEIPFYEGVPYGGGDYFLFAPITHRENRRRGIYDYAEYINNDRFDLQEDEAECLLGYYFRKYYDKDFPLNLNREEFEHWGPPNHYSYDAVKAWLKEMETVKGLIQSDFRNSQLDPIKEYFSIYYLVDENDPDYGDPSEEAIERHKDVIIQFYERFIRKMNRMMENAPDGEAIVIEGP